MKDKMKCHRRVSVLENAGKKPFSDFRKVYMPGSRPHIRLPEREMIYENDLRGRDVTKAAKRAVNDAISRSCLCDSFEIMDMKDPGRMLENILREVDNYGL